MWFVELAKNSPFTAMLMVCAGYYGFFYTPAVMWTRWLRHKSIKEHGWPTPPMDADGDIVEKSKSAEKKR